MAVTAVSGFIFGAVTGADFTDSISKINFRGNKAVSDKMLRKQLKSNKPHTWLSFISGSGQYQESKFEEDEAANNAPRHWLERGTKLSHASSLVIDPPNGRLPALRPRKISVKESRTGRNIWIVKVETRLIRRVRPADPSLRPHANRIRFSALNS